MKRWAAEMAPITDVDVRYHEATEKNFIRDFGNFDLIGLNPADFPDSAQLTSSLLASSTTSMLEERIASLYKDYCRLSLRWRITEREFAATSGLLDEEFPTSALRQSGRRRYDTLCAQRQFLKLRKLDLKNYSLTLHSTIVLLLRMVSMRMCPKMPSAPATPARSNVSPAPLIAEAKRKLPSFDIELQLMEEKMQWPFTQEELLGPRSHYIVPASPDD